MMDVMANWKAGAQQMVGTSGVSGWGTEPQSVATDVSPQMSGGAPSGKSNQAAPDANKRVLRDAVMLVGLCVVLLWIMGAIVFKGRA